ncbi:hypothetical protein TG4357_01057 [Thalassovita gelatinovora]|uniref:Uncharacterized protein n=1 Tax=Thalassovita gelatinovora TaxID=53501 RepID=A0A0P1F7U9_THAGE|nr:hypothetical protein TG4357_01057 [Thalassovita gelatinovora]SEQ82937.1 hypothetical protein SAMN04488043_10998 [Thalassovita gelatinovora]
MNLHNPHQLARETAQIDAPHKGGLAQSHNCASVESVATVHRKWAVTRVLYCYPSPSGRFGLRHGRPPVFFGAWMFEKNVYKQSFAHKSPARIRGLDNVPDLVNLIPHSALGKKGQASCDQKNGSLHSSFAAGLPPVVTRSGNGRLSAPARALRALPCLTATLPPVRLSARRPMSPIAKDTLRAATEQPGTAFGPIEIVNPIAAPCRGGFFVAIAPGLPGGQVPEGTKNVQ